MNLTRHAFLWILRGLEALAAWLAFFLAACTSALLHRDIALSDYVLLQPNWGAILLTLLFLVTWINLQGFFGLYQYDALFAAEKRWKDVMKASTTAVMALRDGSERVRGQALAVISSHPEKVRNNFV